MQTAAKPKATDDPHDFVVVPSDQARGALSDAEIADLLRAAVRQHSEAGVRAAPEPSAPAPASVAPASTPIPPTSIPSVDTTFRATAVNDEVRVRGSSFGHRALRAVAALLLALGIGAAALTWQTFGYAAKKAVFTWLPKWAIVASLPLDKLGLAGNSAPASAPSDDPAGTTPAPAAAPAQSTADNNGASTADNGAPPPPAAATSAAAAPSGAAEQQLQSMAHDLANANQQIETLKATIAELKTGQQQMTRDLAKLSDKVAEQNAKAKVAATHPPQVVRRPTPAYAPTPTPYSAGATPAAPPAYRPPAYSQAAAAPPPPTTAQPYSSSPIPLQPEPGLSSAPRPPMPVQ